MLGELIAQLCPGLGQPSEIDESLERKNRGTGPADDAWRRYVPGEAALDRGWWDTLGPGPRWRADEGETDDHHQRAPAVAFEHIEDGLDEVLQVARLLEDLDLLAQARRAGPLAFERHGRNGAGGHGGRASDTGADGQAHDPPQHSGRSRPDNPHPPAADLRTDRLV
jgi:hypothetical protein